MDGSFGQMNLFLNKGQKSEIYYDRIVLNFCNLPKKNPHHHLINLINSQIPILTKTALYLFFQIKTYLFQATQKEFRKFLDHLNWRPTLILKN